MYFKANYDVKTTVYGFTLGNISLDSTGTLLFFPAKDTAYTCSCLEQIVAKMKELNVSDQPSEPKA